MTDAERLVALNEQLAKREATVQSLRDQATANGFDVAAWEDFWILLLCDYRDAADDILQRSES